MIARLDPLYSLAGAAEMRGLDGREPYLSVRCGKQQLAIDAGAEGDKLMTSKRLADPGVSLGRSLDGCQGMGQLSLSPLRFPEC